MRINKLKFTALSMALLTAAFFAFGVFASLLLFLKVEEAQSAGTINLRAVPSTIGLSNDSTKYTDIQWSLSGHNGDSFKLWITDCAGNYREKKTGVLTGDVSPALPATYFSEPWTPEETTCASHQVRVKTFNSAGDTGSKEITVNVNGTTGTGAGTINLQAVPSTIDLSNDSTKYTDIQYSFRGHTGDKYHLWITDCAGAYQNKKGPIAINIDIDPALPATHYSEPWTPEETTCTSTSRKVRIKTFNSAGDTGSKEITINVKGATVTGGGGGQIGDPENSQPTANSDGDGISPTLGKIFKAIFPNGAAEANLSSVGALVVQVTDYALNFAGIVAFVMVLWAAKALLNSYGSEESFVMAKKTLIWALVGLLVILTSKGLLNWIVKFFTLEGK